MLEGGVLKENRGALWGGVGPFTEKRERGTAETVECSRFLVIEGKGWLG